MPNLVGIGNTQVPTNAMLGGLAYEDCSVLEKVRSGRKNIIINGAMSICQRFGVNSANNINNATHTYHVDRFKAYESTDGILQGVWLNSGPPGFYNSLQYTPATTDTSLGNGQFAFISQVIELDHIRHLEYGNSHAVTCTLSFYVRANITGTFCIALINDGTNNRQFVTEYTISSANTWERKVITIPGDTDGTWNSNGLRIAWSLGTAGNRQTTTVGSWFTDSTARYGTNKQINFMSSTSNDFRITGVQFEVGNYATDFEHRCYAEELSLCQRYYQKIEGYSDLVMFGSGRANGATNAQVQVPLAVPLVKEPTIPTLNYSVWGVDSAHTTTGGQPTVTRWYYNSSVIHLGFPTAGLANGRTAVVSCNGGSTLQLNSEFY